MWARGNSPSPLSLHLPTPSPSALYFGGSLPETAELLNFVVGFYFMKPQTWTRVLQMCSTDMCVSDIYFLCPVSIPICISIQISIILPRYIFFTSLLHYSIYIYICLLIVFYCYCMCVIHLLVLLCYLVLWPQNSINTTTCVAWWLSSRALDLWFTGRGFSSWPVVFT